MEEEKRIPIKLMYGGAAKSIFEMNEDELQAARLEIIARAKEKAFAHGLPIYYHKDGVLVAEYSDGRIVPVLC